jgi:hypothetical protein
MHGAWCVGLIAGDNYVAVGSQRVAQGEIVNFDLEFTNVAGTFASSDATFAMADQIRPCSLLRPCE